MLAHLSRNADALVNVLQGRPMYADSETRDRDIERDAPRPLAEQLADLRETAARFLAAAAGRRTGRARSTMRNGVTDSRVPPPLPPAGSRSSCTMSTWASVTSWRTCRTSSWPRDRLPRGAVRRPPEVASTRWPPTTASSGRTGGGGTAAP